MENGIVLARNDFNIKSSRNRGNGNNGKSR
jgi:hypothetical protein